MSDRCGGMKKSGWLVVKSDNRLLIKSWSPTQQSQLEPASQAGQKGNTDETLGIELEEHGRSFEKSALEDYDSHLQQTKVRVDAVPMLQCRTDLTPTLNIQK
jgi:hypothetical protein